MDVRRWQSLMAVTALVATAGCGADEPDPALAEGPVRPLVVDTDLASDDLVALAFLLSSPRADIRAITVSGTGEVRCPAGLEVVRGLLTLTGDDDIPVACGRSTPLAGDHEFPADWRDSADDGWGVGLPSAESPGTELSTTELLADTLADGDTTLLALGPLTNVAQAFRDRPSLPGRLDSVVVMGGAVDVPGNVFLGEDASPRAEWNVYVDPVAAAEVLGSAAPLTLVGLDATNQAPITDDFVERLEDTAASDTAQLVTELLVGNPLVASGEASFWDPLTAAVALEPELVTTEAATMSVVTEEGPDSGRTVRDPDGWEVTVATGADREALEELLISTLG